MGGKGFEPLIFSLSERRPNQTRPPSHYIFYYKSIKTFLFKNFKQKIYKKIKNISIMKLKNIHENSYTAYLAEPNNLSVELDNNEMRLEYLVEIVNMNDHVGDFLEKPITIKLYILPKDIPQDLKKSVCSSKDNFEKDMLLGEVKLPEIKIKNVEEVNNYLSDNYDYMIDGSCLCFNSIEDAKVCTENHLLNYLNDINIGNYLSRDMNNRGDTGWDYLKKLI